MTKGHSGTCSVCSMRALVSSFTVSVPTQRMDEDSDVHVSICIDCAVDAIRAIAEKSKDTNVLYATSFFLQEEG